MKTSPGPRPRLSNNLKFRRAISQTCRGVGDRDGIVVLSQEKIPEALEGLKAVRAKERKMEEHIAAGMTMPDWVREFLAGDRVKNIK